MSASGVLAPATAPVVIHADAVECQEDLWFSDGNIVVLSSSSGSAPAFAFKVFKSFLVRDSEVFAGMVAASTGTDKYEDGTELVILGDDGVALRGLLGFIFHVRFVSLASRFS